MSKALNQRIYTLEHPTPADLAAAHGELGDLPLHLGIMKELITELVIHRCGAFPLPQLVALGGPDGADHAAAPCTGEADRGGSHWMVEGPQ